MYKKKEIIILLPILIIMLVFVYFADPTGGPILPCIFNKMTGLYCPGCGMTRAVHSILRFQFVQGLRYNALSIIIPFLLIIYYILKYKGVETLTRFILILMVIVALGYGVLRNIPGFRYLTPTTTHYTLRIF